MDNFFADIFRMRKREAATPGVPSSTMPADGQQQPTAKGSEGGSYSERIAYTRSPMTALTVSGVHRATELIQRTMSIMPVQYRKKDFGGGNFVTDMRGLGRRINYLLQESPNPIMTATDMWMLVHYNRMHYGNGFVYIERDEFGFPAALWLVRSGAYNTATGRYENIVYLTDTGYQTKVNVPREDIMHFANTYRYDNGIWGIPTLQFAFDTLTTIRTLKQQSLETAAKGGRVKLIIGEEKPAQGAGTLSFGLMNKGQMDDYAKEINAKIYEQDVVALRGLDKVQNISMTSAEMQMIEQLSMNLDDVARFWGVPRPLLMLDTNSHYNDYQNATMEFHTRTILPLKTEAEKEIARKIVGFKDYGVRDIHICEEPLLAMDPERQAKVDQLLLQNGTKTPNEIRQAHDMPAVADGDEPLASANLMTLRALIAKSDAATQLQPGNYPVAKPAEPKSDGDTK